VTAMTIAVVADVIAVAAIVTATADAIRTR
jgi:hypothetical protein